MFNRERNEPIDCIYTIQDRRKPTNGVLVVVLPGKSRCPPNAAIVGEADSPLLWAPRCHGAPRPQTTKSNRRSRSTGGAEAKDISLRAKKGS